MNQEVDKKIIFSVIMPTYNSWKTLQKSLDSIYNQAFDKNKYEILIVDGGSDDDTMEIAWKFSAKILHNPKKLPEYAKEIGIKNAKWEYIIFHDSDEVLQNPNSFLMKEKVVNSFKDFWAIVSSELKNPPQYSLFWDYTNYIWDPFTAFVYGWHAENNYERYNRYYEKIQETEDFVIYSVEENKIFPLIDGGGHAFKNGEYLSTISVSNISTFNINQTKKFWVIKNDIIFHYSSSSFFQIINKIKFRVINNVFADKHSGFSHRQDIIPIRYKLKKYLFLLYGISVIFPLLYWFYWSVKRRNLIFLFECIFAFYTVFCILFYMFLKILWITKNNIKYH